MEANLVIEADQLTPEVIDGLKTIFSKNAALTIRVEYGMTEEKSSPATKPAYKKKKTISDPKKGFSFGPKKRGRKPKIKLNS
jgi:hypothetical protein